MMPPSHRRHTPLALARLTGLVALGYLLFAFAGMWVGAPDDATQAQGGPVWPASAAALAVAIVFRGRAAPGIFLGALAACLMMGDSVGQSLADAAIKTVEPLFGAWLLSCVATFDRRIRSAEDFLLLVVLGAVASPLLGSSLSAIADLMGGAIEPQDFGSDLLIHWARTAMSVISITPFLLVWALDRQPVPGRTAESVAVWLTTIGMALVVHGDVLRLGSHGPDAEWMLLPLLWAALRFGRQLIAKQLLANLALALYCSANAVGPWFVQGGERWLAALLASQVFLAVIAFFVTAARDRLKQVQAKYQQERTLLRTVIDSIPDQIFVKDATGRYITCNTASAACFGVAVDEVIGKSDDDFASPERAAQFRAADLRTMQAGVATTLEETIVVAGGRPMSVETIKAPFIGPGGQVLGVVGISRDMSARKALARQADLMQHVFDSSANEIHLFDARTYRFRYANRRALENLGYTLDELCELTPLDIKVDANEAERDALLEPLRAHQRASATIAAVHRRKNGDTYPVETHLEYHESDGDAYFLAMCVDLSELQQVRSRLVETERHFELLTEAASDVVWEADRDWNYIYISPSIQKLRGYTADEVRRQAPSERFTPASIARLAGIHKRFLESNGRDVPERFEVESLHRNGSVVTSEVTISPLFDADGNLTGVTGIARDITARKRAEMALAQLNRELEQRVSEAVAAVRERDLQLQQQARLAQMGEMIGIIAHQWRQPLNALNLVVADLEDAFAHGACDHAYMQSSMEKVGAITQRLSSTIDEFRHFYRAPGSADGFDAVAAVGDCLRLTDPMLLNLGIDVGMHGASRAMVGGRVGDFTQVMLCLLENAKDAFAAGGRKGGRIEITITAVADRVEITVEDNAGGIAPDVLPRIFDPYFTTKPDGTGIGLYVAKMVVEKALGGTIVAESRGGATRFSIGLNAQKTTGGIDHVDGTIQQPIQQPIHQA